MFRQLLRHPLTKDLSADDPLTTRLRRRIIKEKGLLRRIYDEWYKDLIGAIPSVNECQGHVLELGSGGGFLKELLPECITSEVFPVPDVDIVLDARALPFEDHSLRAIVMVDVLHHIPNVAAFFMEAQRALASGGVIAMIEPWNTPWSRLIYKHFHPEPFEPNATEWTFPSAGPLSGANGALPWIVFERDRTITSRMFPNLQVDSLHLSNSFVYLASGGVSLRALAPGWSFCFWQGVERLVRPFIRYCAMFCFVVVKKRSVSCFKSEGEL